jgi:hypothetical protein
MEGEKKFFLNLCAFYYKNCMSYLFQVNCPFFPMYIIYDTLNKMFDSSFV